VVRVLEYTHDDPNRPGCGQRNRLLTDLFTPDELPAADAPQVYHERWEQELAFDELNSHLNGRDVPTRSKTPAGVVQEVYGLVLAHSLIRRVMRDAAVTASADPNRVSFVGTLRVPRCRLPESLGRTPADWSRDLLWEVRRQQLRPRREVVPAGGQAEDVPLAEEAGRTPAPAPADQTLPRGSPRA
jgi:hypothetical protein